jgi:hypothetical protein
MLRCVDLEPRALIDAATSQLFALVRADGFKRSRRRWDRTLTSGVSQQGSVQADKWNRRGSARFTLNISVHRPAVETALRVGHDELQRRFAATISARIGDLLGGPDRWWEVQTIDGATETGDEVAELWSTTALPWLDAVSDPALALDWLESRDFAFQSPVAGPALALVAGDAERARGLVASARLGQIDQEWVLAQGLTASA